MIKWFFNDHIAHKFFPSKSHLPAWRIADRLKVDEWVCRTTRRWKRRERVDCVDFGLNAHTRWVSAERKRKLSEPSVTFRELRTFNLRTATHSTAPRERNCCLWYQIAAHNVSGKFNFFLSPSISAGYPIPIIFSIAQHGMASSTVNESQQAAAKKKSFIAVFIYFTYNLTPHPHTTRQRTVCACATERRRQKKRNRRNPSNNSSINSN